MGSAFRLRLFSLEALQLAQGKIMKWARLLLGCGIVILVTGVVFLLLRGLEANVVYFVTPSELHAKGSTAIGKSIRLGGRVREASVIAEGPVTHFVIADEGTSIAVVTTTAPPHMFQEAMGVVVEGRLTHDGTFTADRVIVKHGNEYRPPEDGAIPSQKYKALTRP